MPVFAYSIAADQDRPPEGDGFVRAETIQQAVALVGHPEVNVYLRAYAAGHSGDTCLASMVKISVIDPASRKRGLSPYT